MNMLWQICSFEQAVTLNKLGTEQNTVYWFSPTGQLYLNKTTSHKEDGSVAAYTLAEIAVMLGYTFVSPKIYLAAERLIEELQNGATKIAEANSRLLEAQNT